MDLEITMIFVEDLKKCQRKLDFIIYPYLKKQVTKTQRAEATVMQKIVHL